MASVIPISGGEANANQEISVQLGDNYVDLSIRYLQYNQWVMDVLPNGETSLPTHVVNGEEFIFSAVFLQGGMDMLSVYNVSNQFGQLFLVGEEPTLDNLGSENKLIWFSPDELRTY